LAEDSDIGNLSREKTRRWSTAGFVGSRGTRYEIRDCSNDNRRRLTNIPAEKPVNSAQKLIQPKVFKMGQNTTVQTQIDVN
jgi:hypothetical protein